ncbi:MAG: N-6 DNA methylase [Thermoanaerobaculia bacterium]
MSVVIPSPFSALVRDFRSRKSLTQQELAHELKVSYATVNRWETGKTVPDPATLHLLAEYVRKQGADFGSLADAIEGGSFDVPPKTRRARARRTLDSTAETGTLDVKAMETMLWKAACSIRGEKDAPKFKDYILPLLFLKRLSDVFEDEIAAIAETSGTEEKARELIDLDHSIVRFYLPDFATWPVISGRRQFDWPARQMPKTVGEHLTSATRAIARENTTLQGVIDIVDFNETRNGEREISDDALRAVIELFSQPRYRLGLRDVKEPDFLGRAYEYLLRKFAEGQGQSAGEFFTPTEVGRLIAKLVAPKQGEEIYDPTCGSAGLLVKCELELLDREAAAGREVRKPLKMYGQELNGSSYAIARMNMVLHDMEGEIVRGNTMTNPKFLDEEGKLKKFDIVVANPMWNQNNFGTEMYESDPFDRFGGGIPPESSADWGWLQHIAASLKPNGRAAVVLDTGAASRGSGNQGENKEKLIRRWFVEQNLVDAVILLPDNLFYNTTAAGIIIVLRRGRGEDEPVVLINASGEFAKGRPKNYLTESSISAIAALLHTQSEHDDRLGRVDRGEIERKDHNLSPSMFVVKSEVSKHRSIPEILADLHRETEEANRRRAALFETMKELGFEVTS